MMLVMIFILLPRASVAAKRINEVLDTEPAIEDGDGNIREQGSGEIEFRNVSFRYPDAEHPVLENITLTAHKGETVAFIGSHRMWKKYRHQPDSPVLWTLRKGKFWWMASM